MKDIEKILKMEWDAFQRVENEEGRTSCQDNPETFRIMRKSQLLACNEAILESYSEDLKAAEEIGWNLLMEKYARQMESTAPERYEKLKNRLPPISAKKASMIEAIVSVQVKWMEKFALDYPYLAKASRSIHTYEDTSHNTSFETYLRGELGSYSETTIRLYIEYMDELQKEGRNFVKMVMENTAAAYGYRSLEHAEERTRQQIG
jgi:hypothetical protein